MHDAFDFANREDTFKTIDRVPRQAQIVTLMLQHVCNCCDFIQSYAKDSKFSMYPLPISMANIMMWFSGKRILKNTGSQVDKKIEDFRNTFLDLHKTFFDEAAIATEITALQILDDVGIISASVGIISADVGVISANIGQVSIRLDGMTTQLEWVSSQVSDVGT